LAVTNGQDHIRFEKENFKQGDCDKKTLLVNAWPNWPTIDGEDSRILAMLIDTGAQQTLVEGGRDARFVAPGYLIFVRQQHLFGAPFDLNRLEVRGTPHLLVYLTNGLVAPENNLIWRDRNGVNQPLGPNHTVYQSPRVSPDGREIAVTIRSPDPDIWIYDINRATLRRVTFATGEDEIPVWSPDGKRVAYASNSRKKAFSILSDGSGGEQQLMTRQQHFHLYSWSPDGKLIAFEQKAPHDRWEVWMLPIDHVSNPYPYLRTAFNERTPAFSPDGNWLAYASDESGPSQIYVQRFRGLGKKIMVSTDGGTEPVWSRDGKELYYLNEDKIFQVSISARNEMAVSRPHPLFQVHFPMMNPGPNYDTIPNGKAFIIIEGDKQTPPSHIHVVINWSAELQHRIPL
jgi:tricorn protease-like protein